MKIVLLYTLAVISCQVMLSTDVSAQEERHGSNGAEISSRSEYHFLNIISVFCYNFPPLLHIFLLSVTDWPAARCILTKYVINARNTDIIMFSESTLGCAVLRRGTEVSRAQIIILQSRSLWIWTNFPWSWIIFFAPTSVYDFWPWYIYIYKSPNIT